MVCAPCVHGGCMLCAWCVHGGCIVHASCMRGVCVVRAWCMHGVRAWGALLLRRSGSASGWASPSAVALWERRLVSPSERRLVRLRLRAGVGVSQAQA